MENKQIRNLNLFNGDNMEYMKNIPDKYYDLAVVDPPYGIGISNNPVRQMHKRKQWDKDIPKKEYFEELFRVSKNQIIWGGNYFINYLFNTQCFLIWDKVQPMDFSLAMCEFAWTSFKKPAKEFTLSVLQEHNKSQAEVQVGYKFKSNGNVKDVVIFELLNTVDYYRKEFLIYKVAL